MKPLQIRHPDSIKTKMYASPVPYIIEREQLSLIPSKKLPATTKYSIFLDSLTICETFHYFTPRSDYKIAALPYFPGQSQTKPPSVCINQNVHVSSTHSIFCVPEKFSSAYHDTYPSILRRQRKRAGVGHSKSTMVADVVARSWDVQGISGI